MKRFTYEDEQQGPVEVAGEDLDLYIEPEEVASVASLPVAEMYIDLEGYIWTRIS